MDFRDSVFLAVARNLSFSKAADELYISQPAVTKHIKELESKLDIALFDRKGNKIYLTDAGRLAYNKLTDIKEQYNNFEFEISKLNDALKGKLRIGASSTISQYLLPKPLATFHKRFPKIELFVLQGNSTEMEQKLLNREIDIALVENDKSQSNLRYFPLTNDEIVAISRSNSLFSQRTKINLADLHKYPLVLREIGSGTLEVIQRALKENQIYLNMLKVVVHLGSTEAIKNFLTDFEGIALVSERAIEKEWRNKEFIKIEIKDFSIQRKFRLSTRQEVESAEARLFLNFMLDYNI